MKKVKFLMNIVLAIGLTSACSNEVLKNNDDSKTDKGKARVAAVMDFEAPQLGLADPTTRAGVALDKLDNNPYPLIGYQAGQPMDVVLMIGIKAKSGEKAVFYYQQHPNIEANTSGTKVTYSLPLNTESNVQFVDYATTSGSNQSTVKMDPGFQAAYEAAPADAKAYVGIITGVGQFTSNGTQGTTPSCTFVPTQNPYETGWQARASANGPWLTPEQTPYITASNVRWLRCGGSNKKVRVPGVNTEETRPFSYEVPLTTGKWVEIPSNRIVHDKGGDKWLVSLRGYTFKVTPYGQILGFAPDVTSDNNGNFCWFGEIKLNVTKGDVSIPMKSTIWFDDTDFDAGNPIKVTDIDKFNNNDNLIFRLLEGYEGVGTGYSPADLAQRLTQPIYFWSHGTGGTLSITSKWSRTEAGYWRGVYKADGTYWGTYYLTDVTSSNVVKDLPPLENGKSYIITTNTDIAQKKAEEEKEKELAAHATSDGLIITELYHDNPGSGNDNYTMIELYNPTNHRIDLRGFGLVQTPSYGLYFQSGSGTKPSWEGATVQDLYVDDQKQGAANWSGEGTISNMWYFNRNARNVLGQNVNYGDPNFNISLTTRYNRFRVVKGKFDGYLDPGQTCIYAAASYLWTDNGTLSDIPIEGSSRHKVAPSVIKSLNAAFANNKCRFFVAVDNGKFGRDKSKNTAGGVLQHSNTDGYILVRWNNGHYEAYDAIAVNDLPGGDSGQWDTLMNNLFDAPAAAWGYGESLTWERYYSESKSNSSPTIQWYARMAEAHEHTVTARFLYAISSGNLWFNTRWKDDVKAMVTSTGAKNKTSIGYRDYSMVPW